MNPIRRQRVSSFLRTEIAKIIQYELKDPRIGFVSVIGVEPTEDLKEAKVRVSILGSPGEQRTAMRGLNAARGFIQSQLKPRLAARNTPQLHFLQDESIQRSMEMEDLIRRARESDAAK